MDFVYIEDVARANLAALTSSVSDDVFNVGTGVQTTLNELCELLLKITGSGLRPEYREARKVNNVQARRAAIDKAATVLGFRAQTRLEDGLRALLAWREEAKSEILMGGTR
jgi:UDP-glucose 4-epimerase